MRMESLGRGKQRRITCIFTFAICSAVTAPAWGQPPAEALTRESAVHQALVQNPYLATIRKQSGYAEAALIVAKTYPFNPVYTGYVTGNGGPQSAGITNRVYQEHYVSLELELRGQGKHRKAIASATVSRIEWEIAQQEIAVSIAVVRAYNAVLYRQKKLEFIDAGIKTNELAFEQMRKKFDAGKMKATDLMLSRIDVDSAAPSAARPARRSRSPARSCAAGWARSTTPSWSLPNSTCRSFRPIRPH